MSRWHALIGLARPPMIPYVWLLVLAGFGWAHWDRALRMRGAAELLGVLFAWLLLHAGTLWLNAAVDQDEGDVLFGDVVSVPEGIEREAGAALVLALFLGTVAGVGPAILICVGLAVAYSHRGLLWKAHPVAGPLTNWLGYGLATPYAGWAVVGVDPNLRTVVVWGVVSVTVLGCYFAAQAFQYEEDRDRGYRTLVVTHGPLVTVQVARACIGAGVIAGLTLAATGWLPRLCLLGAPMGWWTDRWIRTALREEGPLGVAWARGLTARLLTTGLVGLGLAGTVYAYESVSNVPVAGLGTAGGHPSDRPRLPPSALAAWENAQSSR